MSGPVIGPGKKVTLHFAIKLEDGGVVDSTFDRSPASFNVGDGSLLEGFEKVLFGLQAGDRESFRLAPEQAFGQPNPSNVQRLPRSRFDASMTLSQGLVLSFADGSGGELPGVVSEFDEEFVMIDFNHPLAGQHLHFDVEIIDVQVSH